jgi:hypothetical protein
LATDREIRVVRTGDRQRQLDQVVEGVCAALDRAPRVAELVRTWQEIGLRPDEQIAYAEEAHTLRFAKPNGEVKTPIQPQQLLHAQRPADDVPTVWQTLQRVQEHTIRGGLSAIERDGSNRRRRVTAREVRGIDDNIRLSRALWSLTEKMPALKTAQLAA